MVLWYATSYSITASPTGALQQLCIAVCSLDIIAKPVLKGCLSKDTVEKLLSKMDHGFLCCHVQCYGSRMLIFCISVVCCMVQSSSVQLLQPSVLNSSACCKGCSYPALVVQIYCSPQNVSWYRQHCHVVGVCVRPLTLLYSAVHIHCTQHEQILHIMMARLQICMCPAVQLLMYTINKS